MMPGVIDLVQMDQHQLISGIFQPGQSSLQYRLIGTVILMRGIETCGNAGICQHIFEPEKTGDSGLQAGAPGGGKDIILVEETFPRRGDWRLAIVDYRPGPGENGGPTGAE
jgi:hypothetical protein